MLSNMPSYLPKLCRTILFDILTHRVIGLLWGYLWMQMLFCTVHPHFFSLVTYFAYLEDFKCFFLKRRHAKAKLEGTWDRNTFIYSNFSQCYIIHTCCCKNRLCSEGKKQQVHSKLLYLFTAEKYLVFNFK